MIPVAATVQDFLALASAVGSPGKRYEQPNLASAFEHRARERRAREAVHVTRDGMGVVALAERAAERPDEQQLRAWSSAEGHAAFAREVDQWIRGGRAGFAMAVCRDLIADFAAFTVPGFAARCAEAYRAMGRGLLATVAEKSYR